MLGDWGNLMSKQWERLFTQFTEQMVRNQTFLNQLGKTIEGSSMFRMVVDRSIQKALESMHMPTRKDTEQTILVLQNLEASSSSSFSKLEEVGRKVDELSANLAKLQKKVDSLSKDASKNSKAATKKKTARKKA